MKSGGPLPARSPRKEIEDEQYKVVRDAFLAVHRRCQIRWDGHCTGWSGEVHHWINRGQRRGLICDPANFVAACWLCHRRATVEVEEAVRRGVSGESWMEPWMMPDLPRDHTLWVPPAVAPSVADPEPVEAPARPLLALGPCGPDPF